MLTHLIDRLEESHLFIILLIILVGGFFTISFAIIRYKFINIWNGKLKMGENKDE